MRMVWMKVGILLKIKFQSNKSVTKNKNIFERQWVAPSKNNNLISPQNLPKRRRCKAVPIVSLSHSPEPGKKLPSINEVLKLKYPRFVYNHLSLYV